MVQHEKRHCLASVKEDCTIFFMLKNREVMQEYS